VLVVTVFVTILLGAYMIQHQNQAKYVQSFVFHSKFFSDWSPMITLFLRKIMKISVKYLYFYSVLFSSRPSQLLLPSPAQPTAGPWAQNDLVAYSVVGAKRPGGCICEVRHDFIPLSDNSIH
jgi:hypothetical protein